MIRVALFGAGVGAEHLAAYQTLPSAFKVLYVVDQDIERAQRLQLAENEFIVTDNIETALADPAVDLVDICLPPHLHADIAIKSLAACKHVICEKPLATNLSDAHAIKAAAKLAQKTVYPVFQYRWGPPLAQLRHLIGTGVTGAPQVASVETHWSRDASYYAVPWRGTWEGERGGAVLGHAIHNHDLLTHFMGPVSAVSALTTTRVNPIETEDCASISFRMQDGALATSSITLGAAENETRLRFVFENLTATSGTAPYAPGSDAWTFTARNTKQQPEIDQTLAGTPTEHIGFKGFLASVAQDLETGDGKAVRIEDGIASIELVTAIYHAARTGQRVELPLARHHPLYKGWLP